MIIKEPDFCIGADNVYRTDNYIVKQVLNICRNEDQANTLISTDTYYERTVDRDFVYGLWFAERKDKNGKRIPATMYTRKYIV